MCFLVFTVSKTDDVWCFDFLFSLKNTALVSVCLAYYMISCYFGEKKSNELFKLKLKKNKLFILFCSLVIGSALLLHFHAFSKSFGQVLARFVF